MIYFIKIILIILGLILSLYDIKLKDRKRKIVLGIPVLVLLVTAISSFVNTEIPAPEIYTTNGSSIIGNEIYIKTESRFLTVKYSLTPYSDPQKEGIKYKDHIPIKGTMTISAKASLFGILWSESVSKDIIISDNGEIDIIETENPGTSIQKISAYLVDKHFFPGDVLRKENIQVKGTTIAGEEVMIEDFNFSFHNFVEGLNHIIISYKNLSDEIFYTAFPPKLVSIDVKYIGDDLYEGDIIETEQFQVMGIYENGQHTLLKDFVLSPSIAKETGELNINIIVGGVSNIITVPVRERQFAFTIINELHTPNGSYDPKVSISTWEEGTDYSVDGKTFTNGIKLTFDNWVSGLMGNGRDFATNVESNLYVSVNQEVISKRSEEEQYFGGCFVVERKTNGSPTTAEIIIYADGKEVYQSGEITSVSTQIPPFHIAVAGVNQLVFQIKANVCGNNFIIGLIED